jgi:hypothetical protein
MIVNNHNNGLVVLCVCYSRVESTFPSFFLEEQQIKKKDERKRNRVVAAHRGKKNRQWVSREGETEFEFAGSCGRRPQ